MDISGTSRLALQRPILFTNPDSARRLDSLRRIDRRLTQPASTTTLTLGTCSCTASRLDIYNSCLHGWFGVALSIHPTFFRFPRAGDLRYSALNRNTRPPCGQTCISSLGKAPPNPSSYTLSGSPFFVISCQIPGHGARQLLRRLGHEPMAHCQ
jgi:hypothetical protein